jgi:hypothetical protein
MQAIRPNTVINNNFTNFFQKRYCQKQLIFEIGYKRREGWQLINILDVHQKSPGLIWIFKLPEPDWV